MYSSIFCNNIFTYIYNDLASKVPTTRTINNKALSANITLSAADVGASASTHTHSNYVPTTRTINSKALSSNISLTASDVGAATSNHEHKIQYELIVKDDNRTTSQTSHSFELNTYQDKSLDDYNIFWIYIATYVDGIWWYQTLGLQLLYDFNQGYAFNGYTTLSSNNYWFSVKKQNSKKVLIDTNYYGRFAFYITSFIIIDI